MRKVLRNHQFSPLSVSAEHQFDNFFQSKKINSLVGITGKHSIMCKQRAAIQ